MFCRKCGNQINDDQAAFCPKCGEKVFIIAEEEQPSSSDCYNITNTALQPVPQSNIGLKLTLIGLCGAVLFAFIHAVLYIVKINSPSPMSTYFYASTYKLQVFFILVGLLVAGIGHFVTFIKQRKATDFIAAITLLFNGLASLWIKLSFRIANLNYINDKDTLTFILKLTSSLRTLIPILFAVYALMLILKRKKKPIINVILSFYIFLNIMTTPNVTEIICRIFSGLYFYYSVIALIPIVCLLLCLIAIIDEMKTLNIKLNLKVIIPIQMALAIVPIIYFALRFFRI